MRVWPITGEPTRFRVESGTLECPVCASLFPRLTGKWMSLKPGDECPKCRLAAEDSKRRDRFANATNRPANGRLDVRLHLVDVAVDRPIGRCSCEHYSFTLGPKVSRMTRAELDGLTQGQARALRCSHLEAARQAALDIAIKSHEESQQ